MSKIIARKNFSNAVAFIEVDECGNCRVYGKFFDNGRGHSGPCTDTLLTLPSDLLDEVKTLSMSSPKSQKLSAFCQIIWAKAKEAEPWFRY